jgi:uncharacterized protein (TIGR03663 family)
LLAVVGLAALALVARLAFLGERIAHWDEARVAYWILEFVRTGSFEYRPIIHGPFVQQVNRFVFPVLGPTDFAMRLPVALLGGLLPLAAWLFRERLRGAEVVALAAFLAADPILLYYSRFMRSDVPLAVFAFVALGLFVRLLDTRRPRYLYAGTAALALAFTTKENALIYVLAALGALALLADHRLFSNGRLRGEWGASLGDRARRAARSAGRWLPHAALALVLALVVLVYFYAPRVGADAAGVGLDAALRTGDLGMLADVVGEATLGSWERFESSWAGSNKRDHAYLPYLGSFVETLLVGSGALVALALVGFLADRYSDDGPRDVVALGFYVGAASVFGYPIIEDIEAPWVTVHAVVALAIPAAVGAALLYRRGRAALADNDWTGTTIAALVLLLVAGQVAVVGAEKVYLDPAAGENELVQFAQPAGDFRPTLEAMATLAAREEGTDVLLYGETIVDGNRGDRREPACSKWFAALPFPWYTERADMQVACAANESQLDGIESMPPVVLTYDTTPNDGTSDARDLDRLDGYDRGTYRSRTNQDNVTVFLDQSALAEARSDGPPGANG